MKPRKQEPQTVGEGRKFVAKQDSVENAKKAEVSMPAKLRRLAKRRLGR